MPTIIDDFNWSWYAAEYQTITGGVVGALPRQIAYGAVPEAPRWRDRFAAIPPSEWPDRVRAMSEAKAWPADHLRGAGAPCKNQDGLGYCWAYGLTSGVEASIVMDSRSYVQLCPESLGGAVNWRNQGNSLDSAIREAASKGICKLEYQDAPNSISPSRWRPGWQEDALNHVPLEYYDLGGWDEFVSALLLGMPVYIGLSWWSHAVLASYLAYDGNELCTGILNSHGETWGDAGYGLLKGTRKVPDIGAFAIRVSTFQSTG